MSITSVRLSDEIDKPLATLAKRLDRSKNYLINQAVKEFLAKQALDESRWLETIQALESVKAGRSIDEEEVNAWLDSLGTENPEARPKG